ncbi:MAG: alpha/beta fold hydrolase [Actinomycetota bacterium]|nr:alpha/beta fold hydrolase [Actinomycetota bacterium]
MKRTADGVAYREEGPADGPVALMLHGYPESGFMWRDVMPAVAAAGWRAVAPDLPGFGDSPADPPGTWERQIEALERLHEDLELGAVALVVHDWGGLIGLRWACDRPDAVRALAISSTGFFADGRWHGMAQALRTEGQGEELVDNMTREGLAAMMGQVSTGIAEAAVDDYWKAFADEASRRSQLDLYRSGDFEKLRDYGGRLAELGVPAKIIWGEHDPFAPVAGAHRLQAEIPGSELVVIEGTGHFVVEDAPERYGAELGAFLRSVG